MAESRVDCPKEEFTWRLRARLPMNVGFTFTSEQLQALRTAFGARFEGRHSIDLRGRLHLPWTRYYIVLQVGRDRRIDPRRRRQGPGLRIVIDSLLVAAMGLGGLALLAWLAVRAHLPGL
jgi:hypothetical protein